MDDRDRRRYETLRRLSQFGADNVGDYSSLPIAVTHFGVVSNALDEMDDNWARHHSGRGAAREQFSVKEMARERLVDLMSLIFRTARSMDSQLNGIGARFRFRKNAANLDLLSQARAFIEEIPPYKTNFTDYGLRSDFDTELEALADSFESTFRTTASARAQHVSARAAARSLMREAMNSRRILDGIMRNIYASDPGKLAAWKAAIHVERDPVVSVVIEQEQ